MLRTNRVLSAFIAICLGCMGVISTAQATMISTEQVAAAQGQRDAAADRAHVLATLERADVTQALSERGVDLDQARARVAAMTDAEAAVMAQQIDSAPAGADSFLGIIVFIFILLLITDILGLTKVFPFTRAVR